MLLPWPAFGQAEGGHFTHGGPPRVRQGRCIVISKAKIVFTTKGELIFIFIYSYCGHEVLCRESDALSFEEAAEGTTSLLDSVRGDRVLCKRQRHPIGHKDLSKGCHGHC